MLSEIDKGRISCVDRTDFDEGQESNLRAASMPTSSVTRGRREKSERDHRSGGQRGLTGIDPIDRELELDVLLAPPDRADEIGMEPEAGRHPPLATMGEPDPLAHRATLEPDFECGGQRKGEIEVGKVTGVELAKSLVSIWMNSEYKPGGRSEPKIQRICEYAKDHEK